MLKNVGVFTELKKIKKYVYDPKSNQFKAELDKQGQEKDGYELYPDHDHYDYWQNFNAAPSDSYTRIQNNPLTKFLILGDFDKKLKAESVIKSWHGMSSKSQISSNAQFLCNDENLNLIISEGLRFLEIGWKYRNDSKGVLHSCNDPEKYHDIYINLSNIVALLFYTSEIRRLPYKEGDPIKKHGSPETKVKLTEENAVKLMNEVYKQIQNISALLGKDFNLSSYNELCQKIFETESELKKCQSEWVGCLRKCVENRVQYGKDEKGKSISIIDKLTDVDKLKEKYSFEYDIPFGQNNKGNVTDYCVWDNISQNNQNELIEIDKRQKPLKEKLNKLVVQKQSMLNQISGLHDKNYNQEKKKIEQLTKLMNIKNKFVEMIDSIDDNNPIQVIKNVVPQIDSAKENANAPQIENQINPIAENENKSPKIDHEGDENIQDQSMNSPKIIQTNDNVLNKNQEENLIQNNNDGIEQNNEMLQNLNELMKQRDELIKQRIEQNKNIIQLNEDILANYEEMSQNPDDLIKQRDDLMKQRDELIKQPIEQNKNMIQGLDETIKRCNEVTKKLIKNSEDMIQLIEDILAGRKEMSQNPDNLQNLIELMLQGNNDGIEQNKNIIQLKKQLETFESTEEILNDDNNEAKNKTNSESEKETNEKLEDLSNEPPEQKVSSETKQDENLDIKKELSTIIDEYQSSIMSKKQEDQQKQKERVNEFQKLQNINDKATYRPTTFVVDKQNDEDKTGEYVNMQQKTNENNKLDNKGKNEESTKNNTTQTDSKNSTDNPIVHFFKWLINKIRSWFGYPELYPLNNIGINNKGSSVNQKENQKSRNESPKSEEFLKSTDKQNEDI